MVVIFSITSTTISDDFLFVESGKLGSQIEEEGSSLNISSRPKNGVALLNLQS